MHMLQDYPRYRHPGWNKGSVAYHADDGKIFLGSGVGDPFGPKCSKGNICALHVSHYDIKMYCATSANVAVHDSGCADVAVCLQVT